MFTITLLIPQADNDGRSFTLGEVAAFEADLVGLFGGFSRQTAPVVGGWEDAGRVYRDTSTAYLVALGSIADGGKVAEAVEVAKARFAQEAIFVQYLGLAEIL